MSGTATVLAQSLGIVTIIWGGETFNVDAKSSTFMPGGDIGKTVVNGSQISFAKELVPSSVKASFALLKGMSISGLNALNGQEMQVQCDTGQVYTIPQAILTKDVSIKGGAGNNVSCEWGGTPATEVVS